MPLPMVLGLGATAGGAAAGGGIAATLAGLASHPLWGPILASFGTNLASKFLSPETAYEKGAQQQMQAGLSVLPELQRAAAGLPTAASKGIIRQVRQEGTRQQQAYATSARKAGMLGGVPGGSTPYRAEQGRIQSDVRQIMGQRLGTAQLAAQQQLSSMISPGIAATERQGIYREASETESMSALARWLQHYNTNKENPQYQEFMDLIKQSIRQSLQPVEASAPVQPYTGTAPRPSPYPAAPTPSPSPLYSPPMESGPYYG